MQQNDSLADGYLQNDLQLLLQQRFPVRGVGQLVNHFELPLLRRPQQRLQGPHQRWCLSLPSQQRSCRAMDVAQRRLFRREEKRGEARRSEGKRGEEQLVDGPTACHLQPVALPICGRNLRQQPVPPLGVRPRLPAPG